MEFNIPEIFDTPQSKKFAKRFLIVIFVLLGISKIFEYVNETHKNSTDIIERINSNKEQPFYIVNFAAFDKESDAIMQVSELKKKGYHCEYLWIPNYASLSGIRKYSVFIGRFSTKEECLEAVKKYHKLQPSVYGSLVSHERKKVEIYYDGKIIEILQ